MVTIASPSACGPTPLLTAADLDDLVGYFEQVSSVDLSDYKRTVLMRRVGVHMQQIGIKDYVTYRDVLEQQPEAINQLLDTFFINVTQFFRDSFVWAYLANHIIPKLIADKAPDQQIRVWSAGCASGEEAYSLAMLLAEALGPEQFQQRVRLYGSDIDRKAVRQARRGEYPAHHVQPIPADLLERYFEPSNGGYRWRQSWRHSIIFAHHDLVQSSPFSRIDLLICRNTFIYLTETSQLRALTRFHFGLSNEGFLLLGLPEMLVASPQNSLFTTVNRPTRVFKKVPNAYRNRLLLPLAFSRNQGAVPPR